MPKQARSLYPDYKRIWIFGMTYSSPDGRFRKGLIKYRGRTRKWLLRDIGYGLEEIERLKQEEIGCDLLLGRLQSPDHAERFAALGVPIMDLNDVSGHPRVVRTHQLDYRAAGALAARYLRQLGHRNFTFLTYRKDLGTAESLTWEGFSSEAGPHARFLDLILRTGETHLILKPEPARKPFVSVSKWLREMERPRAVLLFENRLAQEVCQFASFSGVSIPEDLALIGMHSDSLICESCLPSLTGIEFPSEYWGYLVGEHIEKLLNGEDTDELELIPPTKVVERQSTALEVIEDPLVARGLALMRHHATSRLTIQEMLRELPVTARTFQMRFRKVIGCSPMEELFRLRVEFARQQLAETNHTVDRIAEDCGFRHAESMAQYFKKWTGLTPTQYRRKNQLRT
ncbi:MAG: helix-turn-helix domain-containing protein [Oceanipulchritudo sp.]